MALIKNNNIYIFAQLSAILNLCKLRNYPIKDVGPQINEILKTFKNSIKKYRDIGEYVYIITAL